MAEGSAAFEDGTVNYLNQPGHETRFTPDDFRLCVDGKSTGAVRISFGLASNFEDAWRFVELARRFL